MNQIDFFDMYMESRFTGCRAVCKVAKKKIDKVHLCEAHSVHKFCTGPSAKCAASALDGHPAEKTRSRQRRTDKEGRYFASKRKITKKNLPAVDNNYIIMMRCFSALGEP